MKPNIIIASSTGCFVSDSCIYTDYDIIFKKWKIV